MPFSWTVPAGTVVGRSQIEADFLAGALACSRARTGKICFLTNGLPNGTVGTAYDQTIQAQGGVAFQFPFTTLTGCASFGPVPYKMEVISGALPDGLLMGCVQIGSGNVTGRITGTPTMDGLFTFTVRATDAVGAYQRKQFSIRIGTGTDTITPPVTNSGGASWGTRAAGTYIISYVNGAMRYGNNALWFVNIDNGIAQKGFYIRHSGGTQVKFPGTNDSFGSQAVVEAANAGKNISISHSGGEISMFLDDSDYGDNHAGSPSPTFRLST